MRHIAIGIFWFAANVTLAKEDAPLAKEEVKGLVLPAVSLACDAAVVGKLTLASY